MKSLQVLNLIIAGCVCLTLAGLAIQPSKKRNYWQLDFNEHPNTAWAFHLWLVWWGTLFFIYLWLGRLPSTVDLVLSDFGNLCALGAAIAFCKGKDFRLNILLPLLFVFAGVFIWDIALTSLPSVSEYPQGRIVIIAPSILISGISSLALGWAVVIRCGWTAWLFLLFTASYSVAQLPAYFYIFVIQGQDDLERLFHKLVWSLLILAIGKIIYAWAFIGYFLSNYQQPENLRVKEYWPDDNRQVHMHPKLAKWFGWAISIMVVAFLTTLAAALVPGFLEWIRKLFG